MKPLKLNLLLGGILGIFCLVVLTGAISPFAESTVEHEGVKKIDYPATKFLGVRATIPFEELKDFYTNKFPAAFMAAGANGFTISGQPAGLFFVWDEENGKTEVLAGIPVTGDGTAPDGFEVYEIASNSALRYDYYGPYEGSGKAHETLDAHMKAHNLEFMAPAIEQYITDPMTEPDPKKWLTEVTYLVKN